MAKLAPTKAMEGLTFGADPELFVINPDGDFVSAEGLIPGTKEEPYKVDCGAVQVDGMAAEFNIDPVDNYEDFRHNMKTVQNQLAKMLPKGYKLVNVATATFKPDIWDNSPDCAKMLGCSPDFNAWEGRINRPPQDTPYVRHAGGHIHVGWTNDADTDDTSYVSACVDLIKQMDWYLALWSVLKDKDVQRRSMYGKAGSMRFKPYGVEYRTLSNFWLASDSLMLETWNRMQSAIWSMSENYLPDQYVTLNKSVVQAINNSETNNVVYNTFNYPIARY